ncbi:uncharacterized protein LOC129808855 [Phlebotomus papatasi]|uniref:uncharacterized protein LOC129808855 n=1 Tax=Phlebotomus papatasi TaxID=29031 RepID=UPI0024838458|nr:uncharacterized protein LOC129808855 [Phlebotomus papatasi]
MDFKKLFKEAQQKKPFYRSSLIMGKYYGVTEFVAGMNTFNQEIVIALLKNGDRVFLPKRLSDSLMPHRHAMKSDENWAIKLLRFEEDVMTIDGVRVATKTPILDIDMGIVDDQDTNTELSMDAVTPPITPKTSNGFDGASKSGITSNPGGDDQVGSSMKNVSLPSPADTLKIKRSAGQDFLQKKKNENSEIEREN